MQKTRRPWKQHHQVGTKCQHPLASSTTSSSPCLSCDTVQKQPLWWWLSLQLQLSKRLTLLQ